MKSYPFIALHLLAVHISYCQPVYDNFRLIPSKPEPSLGIQIEYTPITPFLTNGVRAIVFFNEIKEDRARAVEVSMKRREEKLIAFVIPSTQDVSLLVVFIDSLGNTIDNNNDSGYWSPLYHNGESIPGSFASIANMYYGVALADVYKIKSARDLAKNLYEQDFRRKPELKRFYWRYYISSIRYDKEPTLWLNEVNQYSEINDLTEWELRDLSKKFEDIRDTARAKKYEKLIYDKYPVGELALQRTSLDYQIKYSKSKDASEKKAIAEEHMTKFADWPMDEGKKRYLEAVVAVIFLKGVDDYIHQGLFKEWKGITDSLRLQGKYYAYYLAAKRLVEKRIFLNEAEELVKTATDWKEQNLDASRIFTDWSFYTDREVRLNREKDLSGWLEVYGKCLSLQGRNDAARVVFEKAQLYAEHKIAKLKARPPVQLLSESLPNVSFFDANNKSIDLSQYKGKTIVLDFWASWCAPCIVGFKKMNELERFFSKENVVFFFVNTQEKGSDIEIRKRAKNILKEQGYDFSVLFDTQNKSGYSFDFNAIPTTVVIDKDGMVRYKQTGMDEEENLQEVLTKLISEK